MRTLGSFVCNATPHCKMKEGKRGFDSESSKGIFKALTSSSPLVCRDPDSDSEPWFWRKTPLVLHATSSSFCGGKEGKKEEGKRKRLDPASLKAVIKVKPKRLDPATLKAAIKEADSKWETSMRKSLPHLFTSQPGPNPKIDSMPRDTLESMRKKFDECCELLRRGVANRAIEYYNKEHPDAQIELVKSPKYYAFRVVKNNSFTVWNHCNFIAKARNESDSNAILYFAELTDNSEPEFVCRVIPLDADDTTSSCYYCKDDRGLLHPRRGFEEGLPELMVRELMLWKHSNSNSNSGWNHSIYIPTEKEAEDQRIRAEKEAEVQAASCADWAIEYFNERCPDDAKIELVEAISSCKFCVVTSGSGPSTWYHCNFSAKPKDENDVNPICYFAELNEKRAVELFKREFVCRIIPLDADDFDDCPTCKDDVLHPRHGYFQGGGPLNPSQLVIYRL